MNCFQNAVEKIKFMFTFSTSSQTTSDSQLLCNHCSTFFLAQTSDVELTSSSLVDWSHLRNISVEIEKKHSL